MLSVPASQRVWLFQPFTWSKYIPGLLLSLHCPHVLKAFKIVSHLRGIWKPSQERIAIVSFAASSRMPA